MSRRNHTKRRPQARRRADGLPTPKRSPNLKKTPIEEMVVPVGRCYFRSRYGKLRFTEAEAEKALKQAKRNREVDGKAYAEARYYPCPEGGCGDYHLTSRVSYVARGA